MVRFDVTFQALDLEFDVKSSVSSVQIPVDFKGVVEVEKSTEIYTGETVVIPSLLESTTLETANKKLLSDVEVTTVPMYRTSNTSGGTTVYIGKGLGHGD